MFLYCICVLVHCMYQSKYKKILNINLASIHQIQLEKSIPNFFCKTTKDLVHRMQKILTRFMYNYFLFLYQVHQNKYFAAESVASYRFLVAASGKALSSHNWSISFGRSQPIIQGVIIVHTWFQLCLSGPLALTLLTLMRPPQYSLKVSSCSMYMYLSCKLSRQTCNCFFKSRSKFYFEPLSYFYH